MNRGIIIEYDLNGMQVEGEIKGGLKMWIRWGGPRQILIKLVKEKKILWFEF